MGTPIVTRKKPGSKSNFCKWHPFMKRKNVSVLRTDLFHGIIFLLTVPDYSVWAAEASTVPDYKENLYR